MPDTQPADLTDDLRGVSRLTIDAIIGVTDLVEAMHRNIASGSSLLGQAPEGPSSGISGLVYSSVRGVTRLVGKSLDVALRSLIPDRGVMPCWRPSMASLAITLPIQAIHWPLPCNCASMSPRTPQLASWQSWSTACA